MRHDPAPDAATPVPEAPQPVGYRHLIRTNTMFRRLWMGNVVSLLGDWFNTIALYSLVTMLTGSPFALGAVFITKLLPWGLVSPVAGLLVDRFDRRRLMIASDLLRAVVVLGFLVIDEPDEVYLVYVLTALQVVMGSVFQPAQSASVPNITKPGELFTANALMSATWSVMLAAGAALGGLVTAWLGVRAVFLIDSLSYLVSAYFIYRCTIPQYTDGARGPLLRTALAEIVDGWRHVRRYPRIGRIALGKAAWALSGGALVYMLTLLGEAMMPAATALGIGLVFAVRGLGTGLGPILARATFTDRRAWPTVMGACIGLSGFFYSIVGLLPWTYFVVLLVLLAHTTSGANWVLTTVLLQERTEDRYRGRVFATEMLVFLLADTASILAASLLLEAQWLSLRTAFLVFGALQMLGGLAWLLTIVPRERRDETPAPAPQ